MTFICLLFSGGDVPTPPDSGNERDASANSTDAVPIRPGDSQEPVTVTGRQKATAVASQWHPPELLAKLCNSFKKASIKIVESVCSHYAVPPGTQPDRILSDN